MSIVKHESRKTENRSRKRVGECRKGLLLLPFIGGLFLLWYVLHATVDVVYSDYIRIINSYLPDTLDPTSFFVPDILTRIPINIPRGFQSFIAAGFDLPVTAFGKNLFDPDAVRNIRNENAKYLSGSPSLPCVFFLLAALHSENTFVSEMLAIVVKQIVTAFPEPRFGDLNGLFRRDRKSVV